MWPTKNLFTERRLIVKNKLVGSKGMTAGPKKKHRHHRDWVGTRIKNSDKIMRDTREPGKKEENRIPSELA